MDAEKVIEEIEKQKLKPANFGPKAMISVDWIDGINNGLTTAIGIIMSHQNDKVVWPKYVAKDWEGIADDLDYKLLVILDKSATSFKTDVWLGSDDNWKLFLQGVLYGYTVEKEKKYRIKLTNYLYFDHWEDTQAVFDIDTNPGSVDEVPTFDENGANYIIKQLHFGTKEEV